MEYRSPKTLSIIVLCGLGALLLLQLALGVAGLIQILGPEKPLTGSGFTIPLAIETAAGLAYTPAYFFTAVVFLIWLNRTNKNLQFLKPDLIEFSSGWAVGWWFVPFATLWKPFQVVREVWSESNPDFDPDMPLHLSVNLHSAPAYMVVWWIAWLVMLIGLNVGNALIKMPGITTTDFGGIVFVQAVLVLFAGTLAINVVRDITTRQEARYELIGKVPEQGPPPPPTFNNIETEV